MGVDLSLVYDIDELGCIFEAKEPLKNTPY